MSSSSSFYISPTYSKTLASVIVGAALDRFVMKNDNMSENLYFGLSAGLGSFTADFLNPYLPQIVPDSIGNTIGTGAVISKRIVDVGITAGAGYIINRYGIANDFNGSQMTMKIGVLAMTDFAATYISEYFSSQPLTYLA